MTRHTEGHWEVALALGPDRLEPAGTAPARETEQLSSPSNANESSLLTGNVA